MLDLGYRPVAPALTLPRAELEQQVGQSGRHLELLVPRALGGGGRLVENVSSRGEPADIDHRLADLGKQRQTARVEFRQDL